MTAPEWPQVPPGVTFKSLGLVEYAQYLNGAESREVDDRGGETARLEYWGEAKPAVDGVKEGDLINFNAFGQERTWRVTRVDRSNEPASIGFDVEPLAGDPS